MTEKDAEKYLDFCHHVEGYGGFSPWLDEYDPFTDTGIAFVYTGSEDNGQFGLGDFELDFSTVEFSYKDILEKVKDRLAECEKYKDPDNADEVTYVEELQELVRSIEDWLSESNESKQSEARGSVIDKQTILDWAEQLNSEQDLGLATTDASLGGKETQYEDDADDKQFDCIKFTSNVFPLTFVEVYSITPDSCSVHVYDGRTNKEVGKATLTDSSDLRTAVVASIKQIYDSVHNQRLVDKAMKLQESLNKGTSMKTESIDDLKDRSVSHGTLRSIDLIPEFLGVLQQYAKDRYDAYVKANPEVLDLEGMDDETLSWVVDELIDELNAVAPEGTYFGSHPGDGSDFGFWTMDESKKSEGLASDIQEEKPTVYLVSEAGNDYDYDELLDAFDGQQSYVSVETADKSVELPLAFDRDKNLLLISDDELSGDDAAYAKELVQGFVDGKTSVSSKPLTNDYVCIVDGMDYTATCYVPESKQSEGKDDKDKKDDKSCKGKDCKNGKQTENREKPQEGPGAGYTVTIKGMTISDEPKISKDGDKFIVEAPVEYEADAEGYDWSSAYIMNELVDTDEGTFPHNPFKGVLTMEVKDSPDIWGVMNDKFFDDVDNPTDEEKISVLKDRFYKGATFNDFEQNYGGGYSHSKFVSEDDVCMQADWDGFNDIEFGGAADGYASGTLTIDDRFVEDIEFASDYGYNRYKLVEAIQQFVKGRGLEMDWSEDTLYDYVAPYVTSDEITDDYVKEILSEMVDSGVEFTDADGNPADLQLESIQGESKKSENEDEEAFGKFEDAVKSILMDKYGVVDSHGPSDETANSLVLQYGATLRDAFDKGGNGGYSPESEALYIITDRLHEAPHFFDDCKHFEFKAGESYKKSESLTLKQKELKDMVRYGKAEDITTLPDEEAKELRKKGIETVGVSRGTYGMNGALLRDKDGNLYAITARSTNLFYFV